MHNMYKNRAKVHFFLQICKFFTNFAADFIYVGRFSVYICGLFGVL